MTDDLTLPQGCEIIEVPGRNQPFTVKIPGNLRYDAAGKQFVWRFCKTMDDARAVVAKATGWEPST